MKEKLAKIKCFLFDMDGTIYLGSQPLPGAAELIKKIDSSSKSYYFLTNNSSRDNEYYQAKLEKMGIITEQEKILISTHSLLCYLQEKTAKKIFVLGTKELKNIFQKEGYTILEKGGQDADYVVVGFDTQLNYENLSAACQYVDTGVPYVATHPDVRCPLEGGKYIPDCGSIIALIKTATGKECELVAGKPSQYMVQTVLKKTGLQPSELAIVGDRLYTDVALGKNSGIFSLLVLSGEAKQDDIKQSIYKPDIVLDGVYQLTEYI